VPGDCGETSSGFALPCVSGSSSRCRADHRHGSSIIVVAKGGRRGNSIVPFEVPSGGFGAIGAAHGLRVLSFVGLSSGGHRSERRRPTRRQIPIALFAAVIIGGVFLTLVPTRLRSALVSSHLRICGKPAPYDSLGLKTFAPGFRIAIDVARCHEALRPVVAERLGRCAYLLCDGRETASFHRLSQPSLTISLPWWQSLRGGSRIDPLRRARIWVGPMNHLCLSRHGS